MREKGRKKKEGIAYPSAVENATPGNAASSSLPRHVFRVQHATQAVVERLAHLELRRKGSMCRRVIDLPVEGPYLSLIQLRREHLAGRLGRYNRRPIRCAVLGGTKKGLEEADEVGRGGKEAGAPRLQVVFLGGGRRGRLEGEICPTLGVCSGPGRGVGDMVGPEPRVRHAETVKDVGLHVLSERGARDGLEEQPGPVETGAVAPCLAGAET